ncbi:MAG: hypothetical protein JW723_11545 [Bacteroidales bacterium]|nr:hypothetical protein [Bacteroidales bacterium]
MKKNQLVFIAALMLPLFSVSQDRVDFNRYFADQTLRIDYYHTGNADEAFFSPDQIYLQGIWAGNPDRCIQPFDLGLFGVKVYDLASNKLIFSADYNTIFGEYQTTGEAKDGKMRTYHESVLIPRPKHPSLVVIEKRDKNNLLIPVYKLKIDPEDYHFLSESYRRAGDMVIPAVQSGDPHYKVDLVIIGEGYSSAELNKFRNDLEYYSTLFFTVEPYKSRHKDFNITGIYTPSDESGVDEPRQGIYRNTALNGSFNIFDTDRYLLVEDNKSLRDVAAQVPYDLILIMVNRDRYGGGGIYKWQSVFTTGSQRGDYVFLHEFGHAFAGLGDEYYTSDVSYEDFYPSGVEPLDPNVTALLDPGNLKWKDLVSPGLDIPTDWNKKVFDSLSHAYISVQMEMIKEIQRLGESGTPAVQAKEAENSYRNKIAKLRTEIDDFMFNHPLKDKIGAFEGAGYQSEGLYRPTVNSLMHRFDENNITYGKVNEQAINRIIDYYTKK